MFTNDEVADYYNTTQVHYEQWWNLKKNLSLHYGIWEPGITSFSEAVVNTNKTLLKTAQITNKDIVLDAGCGVGGAAFFVNETTGAHVTGLSLSQKQINLAKGISTSKNKEHKVQFQLMDFTETSFPSESFDAIWACESVCHANKEAFIKESFRLLKKGGRLIMSDFFLTDENQRDKNQWIDKWKGTWAISDFVSCKNFNDLLNKEGFENINCTDYTKNINRSAKRMYYAALVGSIPSTLYNILHPKVSRFAKTHYKCGYYQYKALKENLWTYNMFYAEKN